MKGFGATIKRYWWLFAAFLAFLLFLNWLWDTNGPGFVLALLGMIIAAGALLVALSSLELARATTRPFLTYLVGGIVLDEGKKAALLRIVVSNEGNLPAEKPLLQVVQYSSVDADELRKQIPEPSKLKELLKDKYKQSDQSDATYFPGETRDFIFTFGPDALKKYKESKHIAIGIAMCYQAMQREYETIRWFLEDKESPEAQFKPIPEKDYFK